MEKNHAAASTTPIKAISKNISDGMTGNAFVVRLEQYQQAQAKPR
ncbi:MAG: hypothetical protein ACRED0_11705 [Gammaproteobacteria bacterium]